MLVVTSSPLSFSTTSSSKDDVDDDRMRMRMEIQMASDLDAGGGEGYCDYFGGNLLDTIDFDDLFIVGFNDEDDMLPDLEMDPEINLSHEFPVNSSTGSFEDSQIEKANYMTSDFGSGTTLRTQRYQVQEHHNVVINPTTADREEEAEKRRKSSSKASKIAQAGKRKVKVDWTPELHRRFVKAVEQLGVDKAVPSRILELMRIHCLTRHNIASHLQKYRSHRKHLLAREAEATNWSKKRQMYCPTAVAAARGKRDMNTWHIPAIGFPPPLMPHFRPLHVWGHPSVHQSLMHVWPKHLEPSPPPPSSWAPAAPPHPPPTPAPPDPTFWHSHHLHVPNSFTRGTPCFPPHLVHARYPVPGIPPAIMYKIKPGVGVPTPPARQALSQTRPLDFHPSQESIDAALGDVMSKPWLPLPLGLKPPSVDGVMVELQRQGVAKIPPATLQ